MKESSGLHFIEKSDDLFRYTSGRWLVDEKAQQQMRYVKFNLDNLCHLAAAHFSDATKCIRVVKLEGNFNKALVLTMNDGNEVIAKLPCPNAGPQSLTTASEVATLKFLQSKTSIRVPRVFAWNSDAANPVGAEYIIMEKISGVALAETWATMNTLERYK
ncbi:Putative Phosphotransferase family protein [Aspergillus calidoustus]|uniref:Altered inheritance of mitochondria protein 9, mitochondrial n=1 Tax=Aspergillus calidoustus TaxID=454130 RepID=A0A0U5CK04_ASPCI|nr:Putative Phosphotransferase family protein [Aspergillus calidoustus]